MPEPTPAEELRTAAALVRSHAEAASADARTPWISIPRWPDQGDSVAHIASTPFSMLLHGAASPSGGAPTSPAQWVGGSP